MKEIGVGVIGLGRLGYVHALNLSRCRGARLAAVCDTDGERAAAAARELGCRPYTGLQELVDDPAVEAVCVVTPSAHHGAPVRAVARAGKPLFCEKPLGRTLQETEELAEEIRRAGIPCQMGFDRRFDPAVARARELIREGAIGRPVYFLSFARDPFPPPPWACDPQQGGGLFIDMLLHDFDLARFLMGDEVESVWADETNLVVDGGGVKRFADNVVANLRFHGGALGHCHASMHASYGYDVRCEVFGASGNLLIGGLNRLELAVCTREAGVSRPATFLPEGRLPHFLLRFQEAFQREIEAFVECVRGGTRPAVTEDDAVAAFRISAACLASAGQRAVIPL